MAEWWAEESTERYWCEVTGRPDIGADLKAPQFNESDKPYWSYSLIAEVQPGDVVFHYSTKLKAIVGASIAGGPMEKRSIVWAPHGTAGRIKRSEPKQRPGYWRPLYSFSSANPSFPIAAFELERTWLETWISEREQSDALRLPFQMRADGSMRGGQGYLFKMPADFVEHWEQLATLANDLDSASEKIAGTVGSSSPLTLAPEGILKLKSESDYVAVVNPAVQHRTRSHEKLVRLAAEWLQAHGATVANCHPKDLEVVSPISMILEAKITRQRHALLAAREALGQLWEYRYFIGPRNAALGLLLDTPPPQVILEYVEGHLETALFWIEEGVLKAGPLGATLLLSKLSRPANTLT